MKLRLVTMAQFSLRPAKVLFEEYLQRIRRYLPIEWVSIKRKENYLKQIRNGDKLIFLDERGQQFGSMEFAKWLEGEKLRSIKNLVFMIGPAEGFSEEARQKADLVLSLSPLTFQHELALVVLAEQIYRACTILKGEPYHK